MDAEEAKRKHCLDDIGGSLEVHEFQALKFVFYEIIPSRTLQECTECSTLLSEIYANRNDECVVEGLIRAGRMDLAHRYSKEVCQKGEPLYDQIKEDILDLEKTRLNEFRVLLLYIINELSVEKDLKRLKSITKDVSKLSLEKVETVMDLFILFMKERKLQPETLETVVLTPMEKLQINSWKKYSPMIEGFKKRLALQEAEERKRSTVTPATDVIGDDNSQTRKISENITEKAQETVPKMVVETEHSETSERSGEIAEKSKVTVSEDAARKEHSQTNKTNEGVSATSEETIPKMVVGTEHSETSERSGEIAEKSKVTVSEDAARKEHSQTNKTNEGFSATPEETIPKMVVGTEYSETSERRDEIAENSKETVPEDVTGKEHSQTNKTNEGVSATPEETVPQMVVGTEHSETSERRDEIAEKSKVTVTEDAARIEHSQTNKINDCVLATPEENSQEVAEIETSSDESDESFHEAEENRQEEAETETPRESDRSPNEAEENLLEAGIVQSQTDMERRQNTRDDKTILYIRVKDERPREYNMTKIPRGKAVIFNIEKFKQQPGCQKIADRPGSSVDADGLKRIFSELYFDVVQHDNLSSHEIDDILRTLGLETNHEKADCIAIFFLTHGRNGKLLDANGRTFDLEHLSRYFDSTKCGTLAGKPKMFFIQACLGTTFQGSYNHIERDIVVAPAQNIPNESQWMQSPAHADFLFCYATTPQCAAIRDVDKGSWFISTLIETLQEHHKRWHLSDILIEMKRVLASKTGFIDGKKCVQIAVVTDSLRGNIFFRTTPDTYENVNMT